MCRHPRCNTLYSSVTALTQSRLTTACRGLCAKATTWSQLCLQRTSTSRAPGDDSCAYLQAVGDNHGWAYDIHLSPYSSCSRLYLQTLICIARLNIIPCGCDNAKSCFALTDRHLLPAPASRGRPSTERREQVM